jgi:hypothetical protein
MDDNEDPEEWLDRHFVRQRINMGYCWVVAANERCVVSVSWYEGSQRMLRINGTVVLNDYSKSKICDLCDVLELNWEINRD